jgi:lipoyl synthase
MIEISYAEEEIGETIETGSLRPSRDHLPMTRFYTPQEFVFLKQEALRFGFLQVESGPMVRSSVHAHEQADVAAAANAGKRVE